MATYTVAIQFVKAAHVPIGDFFNGSSDPYIVGLMNHKTDDELVFRTSTCRSTRFPEWQHDDVWQVSGVKEGTFVKLRMYDEDPRKLDNDRLGVSELKLENLEQLCKETEGSKSGKEITLKVQKRQANAKVYFLTYIHSWFAFQDLNRQSASLVLRLKVRKDEESLPEPRQTGPLRYSIHFSPMLGRMAGTKGSGSNVMCFLAYRLQLKEIPDCRFEYTKKRSEIKMIYGRDIRGILLRRALRTQHSTIYGFDKRTLVGSCPRDDAAARLLEMTDAATDLDRKVFTYAIMPNGVLHFTQTGPAFAINHLSKHAMHCNASKHVVYSGEFFFVRRTEGQTGEEAVRAGGPSGALDDDAQAHQDAHENKNGKDGRGTASSTIVKDDSLVMRVRQGTENLIDLGEEGELEAAKRKMRARDRLKPSYWKLKRQHHAEVSKRVKKGPNAGNDKDKSARTYPNDEHRHSVDEFTLVIDNSSGTFMPDPKKLPAIQKLFEKNFPGLRIVTLGQDDKRLSELKDTRRSNALPDDAERTGNGVMRQPDGSPRSSISSSDIGDDRSSLSSFGSNNGPEDRTTAAVSKVSAGLDRVAHPTKHHDLSPARQQSHVPAVAA
ncbi:hypothetical protein PYCC9005_000485 [Savitreella phatthalungensis]